MSKLTGIFIVILSLLFYSSITPLLKKSNQTYPPFTIMTISMFALFFFSLVLSLLVDKSSLLKALQNKQSMAILILVGLLNTIGFWLSILGYKYMLLWQQSLIGLLGPIFLAIFAFFILGEAISVKLFLGLAIMGLGLFVAIR